MSHLLYILVLSCVVSLALSDWKVIIKNEDELINTCTGTCDSIPYITNKFNCKAIKNCRQSSTGWNRGFVRCDYCRCDCDKDMTFKDVKVTEKQIAATEPDIYGTCTGTCPKSGLVRTSFRNCDEIRDCKLDKTGWTRGFVRCDYCICKCITKSSATKYRLENVKYNLGEANIEIANTPEAMASVTVVNKGGHQQTVQRQLTYSVSTTTSFSTSSTLELGLSVTVSAGVSVGVLSAETSISTSFTASTTFENGKAKTETSTDSMTANLNVPGNSEQEAVLVAQKTKLDIPYSATQVTVYADGKETKKEITGTYTNVSLRKFRIEYGKARPIGGSTLNKKNVVVIG